MVSPLKRATIRWVPKVNICVQLFDGKDKKMNYNLLLPLEWRSQQKIYLGKEGRKEGKLALLYNIIPYFLGCTIFALPNIMLCMSSYKGPSYYYYYLHINSYGNFWGYSELATHQHTIHWMLPVVTQLWMNFNWVNIRFHLHNPFCKK
jgi:hypothetical protein